jgi:hypothetical protein
VGYSPNDMVVNSHMMATIIPRIPFTCHEPQMMVREGTQTGAHIWFGNSCENLSRFSQNSLWNLESWLFVFLPIWIPNHWTVVLWLGTVFVFLCPRSLKQTQSSDFGPTLNGNSWFPTCQVRVSRFFLRLLRQPRIATPDLNGELHISLSTAHVKENVRINAK